MKNPKGCEKPNSLDDTMLELAECLIRDFQRNLDDPSFCSDYLEIIKRGDPKEIRGYEWVNKETDDVYRYKAIRQLEFLFKRYRFRNDIYSDASLKETAVEGFLFTQHRLADTNFRHASVAIRKVLDYAAGYISHVLGEYDDEECRHLARHGKKATVGVPAHKACEAERWQIPISGSQEQIIWFDSEMSESREVEKYMTLQLDCDPEERSCYQVTSALKLVLVPKTFKSLRAILPNTTIGSYQSLGLGEMIRLRLLRVGYDIRKLQEKHRNLARLASVHGKHVTADLSSASDSITDALAYELLPTDWYDIMSRMRIELVQLPDKTLVRSNSFCTMGIGYTFPLQTLMFLALLKGIHHVFRKGQKQGLISVYGDDMIYDVGLHVFVMYTFWRLGFLVNNEKTFASGHFRESCGGDYYRGVDVRPFQPRDEHVGEGNKNALEAVCYKWINGLLRRWSEHEVVQALAHLTSKLECLVPGIKIVPGDYPDDAGVKCPKLDCWSFLQHAKVLKPKHIGHGCFRFIYLKFQNQLVEENRHAPYYWASLRSSGNEAVKSFNTSDQPAFCVPPLVCKINTLTGVDACKEPLLITRLVSLKAPRPYCRSKISGRRLRRTETFVTQSGRGRYRRQTGTSCFEDRRQYEFDSSAKPGTPNS